MVLENDASITEKLDDNTEDLKKDGWWRLTPLTGLWARSKNGLCQYLGTPPNCGLSNSYLDIPILLIRKGVSMVSKEAKYYYSGLA